MSDHPITPPPELVAQIRSDALHRSDGQLDYELRLIHAGYCAGADQELEACCEWLVANDWKAVHNHLRAARRPKPPSLKEQAQRILVENGTTTDGRMELDPDDIGIIRRALESLPD